MIQINGDTKSYNLLDNGVDIQCPRCYSYDIDHWGNWEHTGEAESDCVVILKEGVNCMTCGHPFSRTSRALRLNV